MYTLIELYNGLRESHVRTEGSLVRRLALFFPDVVETLLVDTSVVEPDICGPNLVSASVDTLLVSVLYYYRHSAFVGIGTLDFWRNGKRSEAAGCML